MEAHYEALESSWHVVDGCLHYERLVVPTGNAESSFHRWFHLKEAFSGEMLPTVIKQLGQDAVDGLRILDCFAGGGTTLVSGLKASSQYRNGMDVVGIERNPFLHHISQSKLRALLAGPTFLEELSAEYKAVAELYASTRDLPHVVPALSTLTNHDYVPSDNLRSLIRMRSAITEVSDGLARDVMLTAAASVVEASSRLRRDGRALRFNAQREPKNPWQEFRLRMERILDDIQDAPRVSGFGHVFQGDGRTPSTRVKPKSRDLIIFSPPYPNNIDYTEIYKMEAWYLGCYSTAEQFRSQRLKTVRSHPSVRFDENYHFATSPAADEVRALIRPLIEAVPEDRYQSGRLQLIRGYVDDMFKLFQECRDLVADNGRLVYVVGNSAHGDHETRFIIAADLLMARLAEIAGWKVEEIAVARSLRRRITNSRFLRESVVTLSPC
ncbi:hypothetical protein ACFU0X_34055 [Streptomyces cellulosae]|uniref:DNA methylase N-4/N-6 domain-containing protein n=1 Tax=Streptomyces cellulosae TaxID=1968 RepID=A0ABW6JRF8_STRCE